MEVAGNLKSSDVLKDPSNQDKGNIKKGEKLVAQEKKKEEDILPLENGWCFWEDHFTNHGERATAQEYIAALKKLSHFETVQNQEPKLEVLKDVEAKPIKVEEKKAENSEADNEAMRLARERLNKEEQEHLISYAEAAKEDPIEDPHAASDDCPDIESSLR
eukprot:gene12991-15281_t